MSTNHALLHPETAEPGPMFESTIRRFEDAWHRGFRPSFDEFMPSIQGRPRTLLIELAHTELELRLKSREAARVEEYLGRYPELIDDRTAVLGLIAAEYSLRRHNEPALALDEYLRRFPGYREELPEEVARVTVTGSIAGREPSFWPAPHDL